MWNSGGVRFPCHVCCDKQLVVAATDILFELVKFRIYVFEQAGVSLQVFQE
jgi:hypothetical protein